MEKIHNVEELYLKIFKIVILVVLTLALFVSVAMGIKGISEFFASPSSAPAAKTAPAPNVNIDNFLEQLNPKKSEAPAPAPKQEQQQTPKQPSKDTVLNEMVDKYVANLWTYFEAYEKSCAVPNLPTKDEFMKGFPKHVIKEWFAAWGENFAKSQDSFEKSLLSNQKVIQYCKEKEGKIGILFSSLNWHRDQYVEQLQEGKRFEMEEKARIAEFNRDEVLRVAAKKAEAYASLMIALSSFGLFMSLALLLIFSKIETNLRGVKVIEREAR